MAIKGHALGGHGRRAAELSFKASCGDFPGGPEVKSPPCNAGAAGSVPGLETKIPRAAGLLSLRVTAREACLPQLRLNTGK